MQPSSLYFAMFLGVVTLLYFSTPFRFRWLVLLVASFYFYMSWSPQYIFFVSISILINFYIGLEMGRNSLPAKRRIYLILGLVINLLPLIYFKYTGFIVGQMDLVLSWVKFPLSFPQPDISPPVGISFYTFQVLAYLLDIYKGLQKSESHLGKFALFSSFFPLQISGPIERAKNLLPQFSKPTVFDGNGATIGLKRIAWGVFKKIVIADRLAIYVDQVFNHPAGFKGFPVVLAVFFFAFQLYCDFSGYTDIVLGAARILGYELTENFNRPYFSNSIQKFWNSWHISLSSWVRDYIFFPLRRSLLRQKSLPGWLVQFFPPLITMLVIGIWHGANWTFIFWGFLHGSYLSFENLFRSRLDGYFGKIASKVVSSLYFSFQTGFTFILVCFGWVFFRANSIAEALLLLGNMTKLDIAYYGTAIFARDVNGFLKPFVFDGGLDQFNLLLSMLLIVFLLAGEALGGRMDLNQRLDRLPAVLRWGFYVLAAFGIVMLSVDVTTRNFIYFNF
jgi:alginate O-acetyltransferase complex protein AlgI